MTNKRKILLIILPVIGLILIFGTAAFVQYKAQFKSMAPVETGKIREGLFSLRTDFVNSYLVSIASDEYLAIDCGLSAEETKAQIEALGIDPSQVKAVFLTHSDYDHMGGIALFDEAEIYLPEKEIAMIDGTVDRAPFMENSLPVPYSVIKDGQTVEMNGISIRAITVEGHTAGSSAFLIEGSYLFTGDLLKINEGKGEVFIPAFNVDTETLEESLKILGAYDNVELVLTGHFGISDNPAELFKGIK